MALELDYQDEYLRRVCTDERESRAFAEVDGIGTFATAWRNKLARLRCYMIACVENQAAPDDLFAAKYKLYSAEFASQVELAKDAIEPGSGGFLFSIPVERA